MKLLVKNDKGEMEKAFNPEDKFALRKKADSKIIDRIETMITRGDNFEEAEKVNSDQDIRSLLIIADRLKITIQEVLDMPVRTL